MRERWHDHHVFMTAEGMLKTALWMDREERKIPQEIRSQPRGVPFWAHNPATSKRPRR